MEQRNSIGQRLHQRQRLIRNVLVLDRERARQRRVAARHHQREILHDPVGPRRHRIHIHPLAHHRHRIIRRERRLETSLQENVLHIVHEISHQNSIRPIEVRISVPAGEERAGRNIIAHEYASIIQIGHDQIQIVH